MAKAKRNYVDNKRLYENLIGYRKAYMEYKEHGGEKPQIPDYVAKCIILVSENLAKKGNFSQYSYIEEMIGDSIVNMTLYIHMFDPEKSTYPFAYMTRMAHNTFVRRIEEEQEYQYSVLINSQNHLITDQLNPNNILGGGTELYDNLHDFMRDFENKVERRRNKKKERSRPKTTAIPSSETKEFWAEKT